MRKYLSGLGYGDQEINSVYDARQVLLIKDAMTYDKLESQILKLQRKLLQHQRLLNLV